MSSNLDSTVAAAVFHHNSTAKRKLEDCTSSDGDIVYLISSRMRKDQTTPFPPYPLHHYHHLHHHEQHQQQLIPPFPLSPTITESTWSSTRLQFFVRTISHNTLVLHADRYDTIKSVHQKILSITGIPIIEQRLIYRGKQLQWEQTLADCDVEKDAGLQLVGRMRSTDHPQAWQLIDDMVAQIFHLCRGTTNTTFTVAELTRPTNSVIKSRLSEFLNMAPRNNTEQSSSYLQIFLSSSVPAALVMLYMSLLRDNRKLADNAIRHFIASSKSSLPKNIHMLCAPIVLEFCKLLTRAAGSNDPLYGFCRSNLGSMVENILFGGGWESGVPTGGNNNANVLIDAREIFPFVSELASKLAQDLVLSTESTTFVGPSLSDVRDFSAFLSAVRNAIVMQIGFCGPIILPLGKKSNCGGYNTLPYGEEIEFLHSMFKKLLEKMDICLEKMEEHLAVIEKGKSEQLILGWSQYLTILKELNSISKLYAGAEGTFWELLRQRKVSLCHLIVKFAKKIDDHRWILDHKEVTNFEARRHLVMMMLPDVKDEYEELHEMLIDRQHLLAESFEYIARAVPKALRSGLFMEFKSEEATGPGVLREWFFLVCQAIFNQQNALFVACPNDRRRFFPNPASKVDPLHLEYFNFSGRVIALALMHKVQVGIVFDRVFFVQLAGKTVSLEDIQDADPYLYNSCKQILEMDPETVDQDVLGLTFVREVEELGSRKIVELCSDGRSIIVTSQNREQYVDLLIGHRFVTSIAEQVTHFAQGFADIVSSSTLQQSFFQSLDPDDFDLMLHGGESAISVEDWKEHTEYNGFKETDPQILWFWKVVKQISAEQRKVLLFFWTSIKYLPVEGFGGLASRLYIYKTPESFDRLPSSHTCFYRLCFPPYPSMAVMQDRLLVITQEHVGCSFGTW